MRDFEAELEADVPRGAAGGQSSLVEARWLGVDELKAPEWRYRDDRQRFAGLLLGYRSMNGRDHGVGSRDNRHVLTVAGSRGGKGVSLLVPNLLLYDGSVLAIDPKGELARITARARREKGQKVVILDPFGENGRYPSGSFNPLDELDPDSPYVKDDAALVADALIIGNDHDPHWTDSARILVHALILFTLTQPKEERTLTTVWRLLALTHPAVRDIARRAECDGRNALFMLMKHCGDAFDGAVAGAGDRFAGMADRAERELASIFSTALTQLAFLDSNAMASVLKTSDLRLAELKSGRVTLYLCLPATRMATHSRWLRVIINLALVAFEREKAVPDIPVLMMLDEFPVLGHMKALEVAAGLMAGFGVKLWVVLQDITQVKRLYRDSWETFISNAGVATFWANTDQTTLEHISQRLGQTSLRVQQPSGATPGARLSGASPIREELRVQRLLASDEAARVLAREKRRVLVFAAGQRPVILKRAMYYLDEPFARLHDPAVLK
jgi:type IV secretion system protein VirD4